jgi:ABC-2 type transport system ATP-binding protein
VEENIIQLTDLTKKYGSVTAVDQLNLSIRKGEIFGLLGPNGAGKSTTILMMLGLTEPTSGKASVCGIDPTRYPIEVKRKVGYLPENVGFYHNRSGLENLLFTAQLNSIPHGEAMKKAEQLFNRVGLSDAGNKKTGKYSRGMLQRLGLADVLIKDPEVIILDEPTLGIDPTGVREFLDLIVKLSRNEGLTVLFSSHDLHQMQQVCDRVGLFVHGKLLAEGDIQTLSGKLFSKNPYIIEAGITQLQSDDPEHSGKTIKSEILMEKIRNIDGVSGVTFRDNLFQIECWRDSTNEIAKVVIESGAGLDHLVRNDYGLDDIYYKYFEGGANNE